MLVSADKMGLTFGMVYTRLLPVIFLNKKDVVEVKLTGE
jgi:hypothetical protein